MFSSLSRKDKDISGVLTFLLWVFNISSTKTEIIMLFFVIFIFKHLSLCDCWKHTVSESGTAVIHSSHVCNPFSSAVVGCSHSGFVLGRLDQE